MHSHHEHWWHLLPKKELPQIYLSLGLRSFALALTSLFIPLYLYQELSYSFQETLGFYLFYAVVLGISSPLAAKFCSRYGVKHSILVSMPLYLAFILLLYLLPTIKTPLILLGALVGSSLAFYWMGMHLLFYHVSDPQHRGEEAGKRYASAVLGALFGPVVGGLLINTIGFQALFAFAGAFLFASALILFTSKENHITYHFSLRSILNKDQWKNSLFFVSRGTEVIAEGVIWPLFIFVIIGDYLSLGIIGSLLSLIIVALSVVMGKIADHNGKRNILHRVAFFDAASWAVRAFAATPLQVFLATFFGAITTGIKIPAVEALEYDKAKNQDPAAYFVSREAFISLGRILMLVFILMAASLAQGLVFQGAASFAVFLF